MGTNGVSMAGPGPAKAGRLGRAGGCLGLALVATLGLGGCAEDLSEDQATGEGAGPDAVEVHDPVAGGRVRPQPHLPAARLAGSHYKAVNVPHSALPEAMPEPPRLRYAPGELCTHASTDWSKPCTTEPSGAAGCLRDRAFASALPRGLELGWGPRFLVFTHSKALEQALPGALPPASLTESLTNPAREDLTRLGGELAAAVLNREFSRIGMLGTSDLGDAIIAFGFFEGWSVEALTDIAEGVLSGQQAAALALVGAGISDLSSALVAVNTAGIDCQPSRFLRPPVNPGR